ncbi:MAG: hypothetical protein ACD_40C00040G0001 [uncultured bacterium]|nr:MAG: hypothetical protein ACD_40C00040G0001 [uncultured bacterium]
MALTPGTSLGDGRNPDQGDQMKLGAFVHESLPFDLVTFGGLDGNSDISPVTALAID